MNIKELANYIVDWRKRKGFDTSWENMPEKLCLVHSEVSETLEAYRKEDRENFAEEIADTMIRLLDISGTLEIDIEQEILKKMEINENRPHKHGKIC